MNWSSFTVIFFCRVEIILLYLIRQFSLVKICILVFIFIIVNEVVQKLHGSYLNCWKRFFFFSRILLRWKLQLSNNKLILIVLLFIFSVVVLIIILKIILLYWRRREELMVLRFFRVYLIISKIFRFFSLRHKLHLMFVHLLWCWNLIAV